MTNILVTGSAGFIGFHLAKLLIDDGLKVQGYDGMTNYYDVSLKKARHNILLKNKNFNATEGMLEDYQKLEALVNDFQPDIIVHLAAQAGVRYSLDNPRSYISSNIIGTFNVMEVAKKQNVKVHEIPVKYVHNLDSKVKIFKDTIMMLIELLVIYKQRENY